MSGTVLFKFIYMGQPTTLETAPSELAADGFRTLEAILGPKLAAVVPDDDTLEVEVTWNRDKELDFNLRGARGVVEKAGQVLKRGGA